MFLNQTFVISHLAHIHMQGIQKHKDDTNQVACLPILQMVFGQE